MREHADTFQRILRFAGEVVAETLWPTRCALCDTLGAVLCDACKAQLPFIDRWRTCARCGSPFGLVQCDLCNEVSLSRIRRGALPFRASASVLAFDENIGNLVRVYKDQGERRLASVMASYMARIVEPSWPLDAITFIPATKAAYRQRGFDHCALLANEVAALLQLDCISALKRPHIHDQRGLSARARIDNLNRAFSALPEAVETMQFLLIDDVFTTGSTLCAATDALLAAGARDVFCLTFARV